VQVLECSDLSIEEKMAIHTGEKRVPTSTLAQINGQPMQTQSVQEDSAFCKISGVGEQLERATKHE
jgi:hypothetical protein